MVVRVQIEFKGGFSSLKCCSAMRPIQRAPEGIKDPMHQLPNTEIVSHRSALSCPANCGEVIQLHLWMWFILFLSFSFSFPFVNVIHSFPFLFPSQTDLFLNYLDSIKLILSCWLTHYLVWWSQTLCKWLLKQVLSLVIHLKRVKQSQQLSKNRTNRIFHSICWQLRDKDSLKSWFFIHLY